MGRIKTIFISISISALSLSSELLQAQNIDSTHTDILNQLSSFREEFNDYFDTSQTHLYDYFNQVYEGVDGKGGLLPIYDKLDELNIIFLDFWQWYIDYLQYNQYYTLGGVIDNSLKPLIDEISSQSSTLKSIYDVISEQGGTKDDWQSLRDSLMSMQNSLYNLSQIQSDTSTMSSTVYSLLNEVQTFNSTLLTKLDSMQESSSSDYNNLYLTLESKLDQVISAVDQFRYFDFSITADVDFQPVIEYLKDISDNGVKISGFEGDIFITNSVDLSEIIANQKKQIDFNDSYSDFLGMNYNNLEDYFDDIRYGETGDWEDSSIAGIIHHLEELTEVLTEGEHDTEIAPIESTASEFLDGGDYYATETALFAEGATNYLHSLDFAPEQLEYDFSNYTNVTDVVQGLNDDYYFIKLMSATNQFTYASQTVTDSITSQFNKLAPLFERDYSSTIKIDWAILGDSPKTIDLSQYVNFSSSAFRTCWDFVIWVTSILFGYKMLKSIWEN